MDIGRCGFDPIPHIVARIAVDTRVEASGAA